MVWLSFVFGMLLIALVAWGVTSGWRGSRGGMAANSYGRLLVGLSIFAAFALGVFLTYALLVVEH